MGASFQFQQEAVAARVAKAKRSHRMNKPLAHEYIIATALTMTKKPRLRRALKRGLKMRGKH